MPLRTGNSPIYGFQRNPSMVDFPGRLAAIFFTTGCNFTCGFCHNAATLGAPRPGLEWSRLQDACVQFRNNWVDAVVITGGEPTLQLELEELVDFFRDFGFAVKLDTNGSAPEIIAKLLPRLDFVAMDIKCRFADYPHFVSFADSAKVAATARLLMADAVAYEFRTTVLETFHSDEQMRQLGDDIRGARRYVLQAFVPRDDLPAPGLRNAPRTPPERLRHLARLMAEYADEILVRGD